MRFKKYHPNFIELDEAEESEYRKWHEVTGLEDCMKVLYPSGPYAVYHDGQPEEKTICLARGHEFFVDPLQEDMYIRGLLMDYLPDGSWIVMGFVHTDRNEELPEQTAKWDEDREEWNVRNGRPAPRF